MLMELAIGDAYGAAFEYADAMVAQHNDLSGYKAHPGHHDTQPGEYTDDTQLSVAIAEAIVSEKPWTPQTIAESFLEAYRRDPRTGYSRRTLALLRSSQDGQSLLAQVIPLSDKSGAAMRAGPIGVFGSIAEVLEKSTLQARLTHDTPDGIAAACAASLMTHYFLYELGPRSGLGRFLERWVPRHRWSEPWWGKVYSKGWMAVRAAVTALVRNDSLGAVLKDCVAFTGDTDTVATIALAAGSCSRELRQDLPVCLVEGLENRAYGRDYLLALDRRLLARVVPGAAPASPEPTEVPVVAGPMPGPTAQARERAAWLERHAIRLGPPDSEEDDDLEPLHRVLEGRRIVLLGEATHGDGTTFAAKVRLVKHLHLKLGFGVLAFESGFYDCDAGWELFREPGVEPHEAALACIFDTWRDAVELQPLFLHLARHSRSEHPLELCGFDCQSSGYASGRHLASELAAFLAQEPSVLDEASMTLLRRVIERHVSPGGGPARAPGFALEEEALERALEGLQKNSGGRTPALLALWRQRLRSLRADHRCDFATKYPDAGEDAARLRSLQMGENLAWLVRNRYADRKVIVWAHTGHFGRRGDTLLNAKGEVAHPRSRGLGDVIFETFGEDCYAIGFTALEGEYRRVNRKRGRYLRMPADGSLEALLGLTEFQEALLDLRHLPPGGEWLDEPLVARPLAYCNHQAVWPRVLDAMYYSRLMRPATKLA